MREDIFLHSKKLSCQVIYVLDICQISVEKSYSFYKIERSITINYKYNSVESIQPFTLISHIIDPDTCKLLLEPCKTLRICDSERRGPCIDVLLYFFMPDFPVL